MSSFATSDAEDNKLEVQLRAELTRLSALEPFAVLGLAQDADQPQIRARFLELTKQFHPNKYARRSTPVFRLANEVFLVIKRAYMVTGGRATRATRNSIDGAMAWPTSTTTGNARITTATNISKVSERPKAVAAEGTDTDHRVAGAAATPTSVSVVTSMPVFNQSPNSATPPSANANKGQLEAELAKRRLKMHAEVSRVANLPKQGDTSRPSAPVISSTAKPPSPVTGPDLTGVEQLISAGQLLAAGKALGQLVAQHPNDPRCLALSLYLEARDLEIYGKKDQAQRLYADAIKKDPSCALAKKALSQKQQVPEKKAEGGLFSRFMKK